MSRSKTRQPIIIAAGPYGENNAGENLMLTALINGLRATIPQCHIVVLTADISQTQNLFLREEISLEGIKFIYSGRLGVREPGQPFYSSLSWIFKTIKWLFKSNLLLIGPGNPIRDNPSQDKLIFHLSRATFARLLGTPYAFIGIGLDRTTWKPTEYFLKKIGNKALFISTRDKRSADALVPLGIKHNKLVPLTDISFYEIKKGTHPLPRNDNWKSRKPITIGFNISRFSPRHFPGEVIENYHDLMFSWCQWILSENSFSDSRLVFFPFCETPHFEDKSAFQRLVSKLPPDSLHIPIDECQYSSFTDLRLLMRNCDLFLGTRFHSVLLAVQQVVPVLAISYGQKTTHFMKQVGLSEYEISMEDLTLDDLKQKWLRLYSNKASIREELQHITRQQTALATEHFHLVSQVIGAVPGDLKHG
jgi:polysaccharide pyruvyl transferase WcaK-like protein